MRSCLLLPALCGCSLLGLYDDPPVDPPDDTDEACTRLYQAFCGALRGCCADWTAERTADCASRGAAKCIEDFSASVADGRIALDPSEWRPCLDGIAAYFGSCSTEPLPEDVTCVSLWVGLLDQGEPCQTGECAPGLECYTICLDPLELPREGDSCFEECTSEPCLLLCAAEHYCDERGVCRAFGMMGEPCEILDDGYADDCGEDLMCDDDLECVPDLPGGEPCTTDRECHSYSCEDGFCTAGADEEPFDYCE
ncbi:MAG: hypothetical protein HYY06_03310 [Deltaproteobacteria bacterium]|nr:hypothetical protein [Deltaproteobacteria bacterium]